MAGLALSATASRRLFVSREAAADALFMAAADGLLKAAHVSLEDVEESLRRVPPWTQLEKCAVGPLPTPPLFLETDLTS